ncbi:alpha-amylase family glycosyl hydrolase [Rubritalea marina]|uniref:alpha-amylase family glycosyl hydrolase n=1 Tax=Rubritalea marina TaxID=361055 RepID=UPI00036BC853|nr:alpha-amylase family glycosyl hydrolase [Rubritalea marina]
MGDFHQHGIITTLHQLNSRPLEELEQELVQFAKRKPMALVLPSLFSELEGPALSKIIDEIAQVPYLEQVIIGLDRADQDQYKFALEFFSRLPQQAKVIWNDGPRMRKIDAMLQEKGLAPEEPGKGRNVWYMFGYLLASNKADAVALHDCDITTYSRDMLARLIYPVANPSFSYKFCKGYYARVANNAMNGRVCRLLVTPLLRALKKVCGANDYLNYLDSFRYPLAGEFSLTKDVIEDIRIPSDWGLEMGTLSEMHRNYANNQICQVDIADIYDHKHQDLSLEDKTRGLSKMSNDIAKSLYRKMATQGEVFSPERIRTIKAAYYRIALDMVDSYHNDAVINGLKYDRHTEGLAVENFAETVMQAGHDFLNPEKSMETPFMPSWNRVQSAFPDIMEQIIDAVDADMEEFGSSSYDQSNHPKVQQVRQKVKRHIQRVYSDHNVDDLTDEVMDIAGLKKAALESHSIGDKWDQGDVYTITYADSIVREGEMPLETLKKVFKEHLRGVTSGVHILPFCPFTSDYGFSVVDYTKVKKEFGQWSDIKDLSSDFKVMADLVINHCSSESPWFQNFLKGENPGKDYFVMGDDYDDISNVVRPRPHPLLTTYETNEGEKEVWCTFSPDQVDLNFKNPNLLMEFIKIIRLYLDQGVKVFRLDAIAFLWKESGTTCVHLEQTHEIIKLLRVVLETLEPEAIVITETNVPNKENLSYFGNDNEAHMIYNFSLPPLLVNTLLSGDCRHLKTWMMSMPPARRGRSYFNFIASHDGIGLRPAEGLLSEKELKGLTDTLCSFGGEISMRKMPDGTLKPYEANISLFSAMAGKIGGARDQWQVQRYLCAHTIMLALEGVPAFYIHSLVGTENDLQGVANTGELRSINRHNWRADELEEKLDAGETHHREVFDALKHMIKVRRRQPAFHPNATQYTLHFGKGVLAFWRESLDRTQSVFAVHNISDRKQSIPVVELNLILTETWVDLLTGNEVVEGTEFIELDPYQAVWISNIDGPGI